MSGNFLVDTNVLIYSYDRSDQVKQKRAREVLDWLVSTGGGVLSTQILAEFFWTLSRKLSERFPAREAYAQLEKQAHAWRVVSMTPAIVLEAARGAVHYQLALWDAQIWATAKINQIPRVVSEDFSSGSRIEGVEFLDPFRRTLPGEQKPC